jgi:hypothetical protein
LKRKFKTVFIETEKKEVGGVVGCKVDFVPEKEVA